MKPPPTTSSKTEKGDVSREIESWGNDRLSTLGASIDGLEMSPNERNQAWWASLPMTYVDWDSSTRTPETAEDFASVDRFYFGTNPYIDQKVDFSRFKSKRVLEVGCGAGSATCRFASEGAQVTAVDLTAEAVQNTKNHAAISNVADFVSAIQCDAEELPGLADDSYDFVYSWGVMHHSSRPEACFAQAARVLKPGGQGMIMVYHESSIRYWGRGALWLLLKGKLFTGSRFNTVQRFYTDGYYHKHYTRKSLANALTQAGFRVTSVDVTHMSSRMLPFIPNGLREWLKQRWGWLLVANIEKI